MRVGIIGVGNCASSLVQGVHFYRDADPEALIPGLMHTVLGGYHVGDIEFSAAFDVDSRKVGADLGQAIWAAPNNTIKFTDVPHLGVPVHRGPTTDGLGHYGHARIEQSETAPADVARILADTGTDVIVNYLPVGSEDATRWYMEQALVAGTGVVNCIPVFIAREAEWSARFAPPGCPSWGTTSRARWGPPSCTAPWPASSATGGSSWSAPASSTWAGTWTSTTCWSAPAWRARRSPRPTP